MSELDFAAMRAAMVDSQLRTSDVNDVRVITAMAHVPREKFVPADRQAAAYIDRAVPLGNGRVLNPPLATGRLLVAADVRPGDKVLLIGAATGYAAAVVTALGGTVTAVEEDTALAEIAKGAGVSITAGALKDGAAAGAPFDVLLIDGAVDELPQSLIDQLAEGGRVAAGIIENGVSRLCAGKKLAGVVGLTRLFDMEMAVLPGFAKPKSFAF